MPKGGSKKGERRGGRQVGTPNKATADARAAIADFVDGNVHRLTEWLDRVAVENPAKAFELFQSVVEYHIPKLARTEHTGKDGAPVETISRIELVPMNADRKD